MRYNPHLYQTEVTQTLLGHPFFGIFLRCGLGKTVVVLTALEKLINEYFCTTKILVVAPLRVADLVWQQEAEKWDHLKRLRFSKILGSVEKRIAAISAPADIYIINRENIPWLVAHHGSDWPYDTVILDELSSFKSHTSKRFKALKQVRNKIKRIYGLTGTPASNGLMDLWAQLNLLDEGRRLGRYITTYRNKYFYALQLPIPGRTVFKYILNCPPEKIYAEIRDITVSVENDAIKLPERVNNEVPVSLSTVTQSYYDCMINTFNINDIAAVNPAVMVNKLMQLSCGGIYDNEGVAQMISTEKLEALDDLIESQNGRKVLVLYGYEFDRIRILARYKNIAIDLQAPHGVERWQNEEEHTVAVAHPAACGHGLNFQSFCDTIIWVSLPWSLELYSQTNARIHRQGQLNTCYVHHLLATDVDREVLKRLNGKENTQQSLLAGLRPIKANSKEKNEAVPEWLTLLRME